MQTAGVGEGTGDRKGTGRHLQQPSPTADSMGAIEVAQDTSSNQAAKHIGKGVPAVEPRYAYRQLRALVPG
jgi:hypothetical protein